MNHGVVIDSGTFFEIVPNTRKIIVPTSYKTIGTVGDHLSEQLTFKCPKLIDGHDIENCARHYITWKNVKGNVGHDGLAIADSDDEYIYFAWTIRDALAVAAGIVSFSVHFEDLDANDEINYRWSTTTCDGCEILDSINAALSTYEAIYVSGDTFVIADYNPVKDETLSLETNGLIPEGTIKITHNGSYDVGKFSMANVLVNPPSGILKIAQNGTYDVSNYAQAEIALTFESPQISVSDDGEVTATANGIDSKIKLSPQHDMHFAPSNIRKGINIFGIEGNYAPIPEITVSDSGLITATAQDESSTYQLSSNDDRELIAENIRNGKTIFGVTGTYCNNVEINGVVWNRSNYALECTFLKWDNGSPQLYTYEISVGEQRLITCVKEAIMYISSAEDSGNPIRISVGDNVNLTYLGERSGEELLIYPLADAFHLEIEYQFI